MTQEGNISYVKRAAIVLVFVAYFIANYFTIGTLALKFGQFHTLALPFEAKIPFIPATYFTYIFCFIIPPAAFMVINDKKTLYQMVLVFFLSLTVCDVIWFLYPVHYDLRPDIYRYHFWYASWMQALFELDTPPINCFPSLHVLYAFLSYFYVREHAQHLKKFFHFMAWAIAISTLTFKQHYVADVLAGYLIARLFAAYFVTPQILRDE
ncbi:phosphatase PAP2 family protein [bacterium]|nr:phosphatase PAP2 family protein [bacterium]